MKNPTTNLRSDKMSLFYIAMLVPYLVTLLSHTLLDNVRLSAKTWQVTEILINYEGGFVRRGLIGQLIYMLNNTFGIEPLFAAYFFSIASALLFFYLIFKDTIKRGYSILLLPTTMFLSSLFVSGHWVRKDFFIMIIFYLIVRLLRSKSVWKFLYINILLIIGALSHEVILFISAPIIFISILSDTIVNKQPNLATVAKTTGKCILYFIPSLIAAFLVLHYKGDLQCATEIWASWSELGVLSGNMSGAIAAIGWEPEKAIAVGTEVWSTVRCGVYYPIMWSLLSILAFIYFVWAYRFKPEILGYKAENDYPIVESSYIIIFQFFAMVPLLLVFADTSRAFFYVVMSAYIIRLYDEKFVYKSILGNLPRMGENLLTKLNAFIEKKPKLFLISAFIVGLPSISVSALEHIVLHGQIGFFVKSILEMFK